VTSRQLNRAERDLQIKWNVPNSSFWNSNGSEEDGFIENDNDDDDIFYNKSDSLCIGQMLYRVSKTQSTSNSQNYTSGVMKHVQVQVTGKSWFIPPH